MSKESYPQPIELPGLTNSLIDSISADIEVKTGSNEIVHPQLHLEGGDDAFTHDFTAGRLSLKENRNGSGSTTVIGNGNSGSTIIIGNQSAGRIIHGNITVLGGFNASTFGSESDVTVISGDVQASARRRASLLLPQGHEADHDVTTVSGDVDLEALTARVIKVASKSGDLALQGVAVEVAGLKTMSGDIDLNEVAVSKTMRAESMSGDVNVREGSAPSWRLSTMSGDVTAQGAMGEVDASTMSGRTRIS